MGQKIDVVVIAQGAVDSDAILTGAQHEIGGHRGGGMVCLDAPRIVCERVPVDHGLAAIAGQNAGVGCILDLVVQHQGISCDPDTVLEAIHIVGLNGGCAGAVDSVAHCAGELVAVNPGGAAHCADNGSL